MSYSHITHDEFERIARADARTELEKEFVKRWDDIQEEEVDRSVELLGNQLEEAQKDYSAVEAKNSLLSAKLKYLENKIRSALCCHPRLVEILLTEAIEYTHFEEPGNGKTY